MAESPSDPAGGKMELTGWRAAMSICQRGVTARLPADCRATLPWLAVGGARAG